MRSLENMRLREYRKQILATYRSKIFEGIFKDIFEKIENVLIELPGLLGTFMMSF